MAAYGHSKVKRTDCPLVTLALVLDNSDFSKKSTAFEGNVSESKTLAKMIKGLESPTIAYLPGSIYQKLTQRIHSRESTAWEQVTCWRSLYGNRDCINTKELRQ